MIGEVHECARLPLISSCFQIQYHCPLNYYFILELNYILLSCREILKLDRKLKAATQKASTVLIKAGRSFAVAFIKRIPAHRGYYTVTRRYGFCIRVMKTIFHELV